MLVLAPHEGHELGIESVLLEDVRVAKDLAQRWLEEWAELDEARRERRRAAWDARTRERLTERFAATPLSEEQRESTLLALRVERESIGELFRAARDGGGFDQVRKKIGELRAKTDEEVRGLLPEEKYAPYAEMRSEEAERFERRMGGGGGGRRRQR